MAIAVALKIEAVRASHFVRGKRRCEPMKCGLFAVEVGSPNVNLAARQLARRRVANPVVDVGHGRILSYPADSRDYALCSRYRLIAIRETDRARLSFGLSASLAFDTRDVLPDAPSLSCIGSAHGENHFTVSYAGKRVYARAVFGSRGHPVLGLPLHYLLKHPMVGMTILASNPLEVWTRVQETYVAQREARGPQCQYEPDENWERRLHEQL